MILQIAGTRKRTRRKIKLTTGSLILLTAITIILPIELSFGQAKQRNEAPNHSTYLDYHQDIALNHFDGLSDASSAPTNYLTNHGKQQQQQQPQQQLHSTSNEIYRSTSNYIQINNQIDHLNNYSDSNDFSLPLTEPEFIEDHTPENIYHRRQEHVHSDLNDFPSTTNPFSDNYFNSNRKFLNRQLIQEACKLDRGCQRKDRLNETYLSYCTRYKLENLLSNKILDTIMHHSIEQCEKVLLEFIQLDELINHFDNLFAKLLTRYNCHNGYSVKWSCDDCKRAYKDWLCSTNLPYYMNGEVIKPCISFCERVEQRCPYLHPIQKEQYGGQPVFICRDPNIPFVPEITPDIPYNEPGRCYDLCHLTDNLTELITDSLSKYDYDKCPEKGSIAEEVRNNLQYCNLEGTPPRVNQSSEETDGIYKEFDRTHGEGENYANNVNFTSFDGRVLKTLTINQLQNQLPVHKKKLNELREVLAVYKSQPKSHSLGHHSHR